MPRSGRGVNHAESDLAQGRCRVAAEEFRWLKRFRKFIIFVRFLKTGYNSGSES